MLLSTGHALAPEAFEKSPDRAALLAVVRDTPRPPVDAQAERPPSGLTGFVPQVQIELPAPDPAEEPPEPALAGVTADQLAPPVAPEPPQSPAWKADIAQLTTSEVQPTIVSQLNEPGLVAGAPPTLAARIDAMQVQLPSPMVTEEERAALAAIGPTKMTVRIGDEAVGKVAFRTSDAGIDVQLSGLLDLVADRLPVEEFTRLRNSEAADNYVSPDQLRAVGLTLDYDPVYDELRLSA